jgi:hypothetical protein
MGLPPPRTGGGRLTAVSDCCGRLELGILRGQATSIAPPV